MWVKKSFHLYALPKKNTTDKSHHIDITSDNFLISTKTGIVPSY
jgi:hypothetical protein